MRWKNEKTAVLAIACAIIGTALVYLLWRDQTYVHIDAIAHVNKGRGLFDNYTPGILQLGSIWLPLPHILIAPLTWFDVLWTTGLAGSLLSAACFVGTGWFLFGSAALLAGSNVAGWIAFLAFALNPRLIYLFTTPMTEPLMILCAAGTLYFLLRWIQTQRPYDLAMSALMVFGGTLTRYEGWAIGAAAVAVVFVAAAHRRIAATLVFTAAVCTGPLLWMIFNWIYFEDPLFFTYGRGSALAYAQDHLLRTGKTFPTAGSWIESFMTYFVDVAYSVNPMVLWIAIAGIGVSWFATHRTQWQMKVALLALTAAPFGFYVYNLQTNLVPILMPGLFEDQPESIYNVRYGTVMAATVPIYAALALYFVFSASERSRRLAFLVLAPLMFPDPIPEASLEAPTEQLTGNLFYKEGIHNQSFWLPPFIEVADRLKNEIGDSGYVLTDTRIVHPVVWRTAIPMGRFIHEMNRERWVQNLKTIDPDIKWLISEEGDQLWHAHGPFLSQNFVEVLSAKTPTTGTVRLYRRRE